jgi:hypothetical protein
MDNATILLIGTPPFVRDFQCLQFVPFDRWWDILSTGRSITFYVLSLFPVKDKVQQIDSREFVLDKNRMEE